MKALLETTQKQTMSQKQIQSSEILQMNALELQAYLHSLAIENPLLELEEDYDEREKKLEWLKSQDEQNRIYERQERKDEEDSWFQKTLPEKTLQDSLLFQLSGLHLSSLHQQVLEYMIQSLDENGLLQETPEEIACILTLSVPLIHECLQIFQSLEPCGVGAHTLQECLCLQLLQKCPQEKNAFLIVEHHLELLGKNQLPQIARKLHVPLPEIVHAQKVIRSLNPRPGASFGEREFVPYISPDVIVVHFEGYFNVLINDSMCRLPRINNYYQNMCDNSSSDEVKQYLTECKQEIDWIATCIEHRKETLASLTQLIISRQSDFFLNGPGHLHAFSQSEAAALLGVHESTVSRSVRDKYLQCSFGIYPLRYFFVQGMAEKDQILNRIKALIAQEDKTAPLSDSHISDQLTAEGLHVSRRVVAKYRNLLDIPDGTRRKTY